MMIDIRTFSTPPRIRMGAIILGAMQGLLVYSQNRSGGFASGSPVTEAVETFLIIGPISFVLLVEHIRLRQTLIYALGMGAVLALLELFIRTKVGPIETGGSDLSFALVVSGFWVAFAGATYFPAWRDCGHFPPSYVSIFTYAWNNLVVLAVAGAFILGGWAILMLWGALFNIIGIDYFTNLFKENWFGYLFSFTAFSFGIAFSREMEKVIFAARALVLGLCAILAIALAAIGTGFVLALPMTGLQPLWDTGSAASILIFVVLLIALGAVAVVREGGGEARPALVVNYVLMAGLVSASVLSVLAIYAVVLRIDQYGLTPDRQYALAFALGAAAFAMPLGWGVLRFRRDWQKALVKSRSMIGLATVVLALGVHLPPFEPYSLSASSQMKRLKSGKISVSEFDFGYLRYKLGKPGLAALVDIRNDTEFSGQGKVAEMLAILDKQESYYDWQATELAGGPRGPEIDMARLEHPEEYLRLYPESAELASEAVAYLLTDQVQWLNDCRDNLANERCVLIYLDMNDDGEPDMIASNENPYFGLDLYTYDPISRSWNSSKINGKIGDLSLSKIRDALEAGDVRVEPAVHNDLIIGGTVYH